MAAPVYGLVLAGGQSRRMQKDKAFLQYHEQPQYKYTYQLLQQVCTEVYLSCRPSQVAQFRKLHPGIPLIPDLYEDIGPMAALLSAFQVDEVAWLTLACDMPFMNRPTLQHLLRERDPSAIATTYQLHGNDFPETMCTIWEPSAFPLLQEARQQEQYSLTRLLKRQNIRTLAPTDAEALRNINTPEEYAEVREKLK
ncbi:MAG: NTP transferase domain-containing protein [Cyclobacteriaceae bacterium]